jgi:DNA-binding GntR family transcriptional regulator
MDSMMIHFDRVRLMRNHTTKEIEEILGDHKIILDALKQSDKSTAVELMTRHLSRYEVDEVVIKRDHPDYFL